MSIPADLKYTESHEWLRQEADGSITVGITTFAQDALGDLVFVELPEAGRKVVQGEACAVVESVKAASDVYAPIAGTVLESNAELAGAPELINQDCYGKGWMIRVQPASAAALDALLAPAAYAAALAAEGG